MSEAPRDAPLDDQDPGRQGLAGRLVRIKDQLLELPAVARSIRALMVVAGGLRSEPITLRAAALTYLTLLSLIPLLAVVFSVFQAVVGTRALEAQLQEYILDNLAVGAQASFQTYIERYVRKASGAALGGLGFAFLLASSVSLLANIEAAFNHIFRAPKPRRPVLRFGIYWCLLTLGPFLLSLSLATTAMLERSSAKGPLQNAVGVVLPLIITWGAFMLLYMILPAVQVKRRAAFLGAFVAGTAWEVAKIGYAFVSSQLVRRDAIYGSLSAIPTFLLWTYVSWIIVLYGARIAYAAQANWVDLDPTGASSGPLERELLAARIMVAIGRAFRTREVPPGARRLAEELCAHEGLVGSMLAALADRGLVRQLVQGGYVPARALDEIPLSEIRLAARGRIEEPAAREHPFRPEVRELLAHWQRADAAAGERLTATLADLVREEDPRTSGTLTDPGLTRPGKPDRGA